MYALYALDRFGQDSRGKQVIFENKSGPHFVAEGTLAVGEETAYWVRLRNENKDLNLMMTVTAQ